MTRAEFIARIRQDTSSDTNIYTNAELAIDIFSAKDDIVREARKKKNNWFDVPMYRNLLQTASDGDITQREYPLPVGVREVRKIIAYFANTNGVELLPVDYKTKYMTWSETEILRHFSNSRGMARYDVIRNSIFIFSGEIEDDVTNGLFMMATMEPETLPAANFSDTDDLSTSIETGGVTLPADLHPLWATKTVMRYKQRQDRPIDFVGSELTFDKDLQVVLNQLISSAGYEEIQLEPDLQSHVASYDNGWNL